MRLILLGLIGLMASCTPFWIAEEEKVATDVTAVVAEDVEEAVKPTPAPAPTTPSK